MTQSGQCIAAETFLCRDQTKIISECFSTRGPCNTLKIIFCYVETISWIGRKHIFNTKDKFDWLCYKTYLFLKPKWPWEPLACVFFFLSQPFKFSNNLLFFSKETFTVSYEVTLVKPLLDPTFNLSKLSDDISNIFSSAKYLVNDFSSYFIDVQFFF